MKNSINYRPLATVRERERESYTLKDYGAKEKVESTEM